MANGKRKKISKKAKRTFFLGMFSGAMIRRLLFLGLGSVAIIITMTITIGKYWVDIFEKYQEKEALVEELAALQDEEKVLRADADKLQDPDYVARYAREKYLYSKDGEFIIKIPGK